MSFFRRLFGGGRGGNPGEAAMPYMAAVPGIATQYYNEAPALAREQLNPYVQSGRAAEAISNPLYERMSRTPDEFLNAIMRGYTPSEGYRFKENRLLRTAQNAAAQGGYAGTPYSQEQQAELVQGLLGGDMQQFLQNILGIQNIGLEGQQSRQERGYGASSNLANILSGNRERLGDVLAESMANRGGLAFQGAQQQLLNRTARRNALLGFLGRGIGAAFGSMNPAGSAGSSGSYGG